MRLIVLFLITALTGAAGQTSSDPSNAEAQKTYREAWKALERREKREALDKFKKANKQDDGHCGGCLRQIITLGLQLDEFKMADEAARQLIALAQDPETLAAAHAERGAILLQEGTAKHKDEHLREADREFRQALAAKPKYPKALYGDALALARLKQDEDARAMFQQLLPLTAANSVDRVRVQRFVERPELARARIAPAFAVATIQGARLSMDSLAGKVVLMDFWAIWCRPCEPALPHIKDIARKFKDEPLVVISVSLDQDEEKWKSYVEKHQMTWPQYRDGSFEGQLSRAFGVHAIPHTFTIDADGVVQDEQIGDQSIEGKLKKLIARARQLQSATEAASH